MIYPKSIEETINFYKKLPGIGEKTAERLALFSMTLDDDVIDKACESLKQNKELTKCKFCGNISEDEVCSICNDGNRNQNLICVVEDYKSLYAFEKTGNYDGTYHILGGLISPVNGINPSDINIASLVDRVTKLENPEVIVALKSTIEGETTTLYIKRIMDNKSVKVSRLSYGIPIGADIDYLDFMTLEKALSDRKEV